MYSDEQLIRDYLNSLPQADIVNSVHLININFERDSFDDIIDAILSFYLDVAQTAKTITNGMEEEKLKSSDTREELIREQELKIQILNKLLDYEPIRKSLSKKLNSESKNRIKQTS